MKKLTINEQIFLIAIWTLKDEAYGVKIHRKITEMTGHSMLFGSLYNSLENLAKKGYVNIRKGEPTPERGGNNKVYYSITEEGMAALQKAKELQKSLWDNMPDVIYEGKKS